MLARVFTAAVGIPLMLYVACVDSYFVVLGFALCLAIAAFVEINVAVRSFFALLPFWLVWVVGCGAIVILARFNPADAISFTSFHTSALLLFVLTIWAGDTAAMLFGKLIGRNKLAPNISPNKTWEGSIANLLAASCVGYFLAHLGELSPIEGLGVGAISGTLGQVGDLVESAWKRRVGIKDSGQLLPGHGGVLDRFDSMLFAAPYVAVYLCLIR